MSKTKERAEKICLNCNAELYDRYCHKCGQENIEPKQSFWHFVSHFFYDITHFDGKFFSTLKYLIWKPGFLSSEYIKGRRRSYLDPIRMYVFSASLFFLIFFSMFTVKKSASPVSRIFSESRMNDWRAQAYEGADTKEDSARIDSAFHNLSNVVNPGKDSANRKVKEKNRNRNGNGFNIAGISPDSIITVAKYDSSQNALPADERDSWLVRKIKRQGIDLKERYRDDESQLWTDILNKFIHTFPYLLFISLPLYALYLKLLYIRRKQFYFVDHGVFLIHLYIFTFIFMLFFFLLGEVGNLTGPNWMIPIQVVLVLFGIYYTFRAMRNFYKQGWFKTFIKFCLLNLLAFVSLIFLFGIFFLLSVLQI